LAALLSVAHGKDFAALALAEWLLVGGVVAIAVVAQIMTEARVFQQRRAPV
jgi:hypothetical protein